MAQMYCLIVGATLLLVGLLGFLAESKFDTSSGGDPGSLDGEDFLIFEVNGWHNVVHILYGLVTIIGLIDGHDVLGIIPVNPADNILHVLLSASALAVGLLSDRDNHHRQGDLR